MYEFCAGNFTIVEMISHHFVWLKEEDLKAVRVNIAEDGHCKFRGIRKLHQIIPKPNKSNGVFIKGYAYLCNACTKGRV